MSLMLLRQFTVAFYTGLTTVGCAPCFSGILYRKVAARTPHVPIKKKLREKENKHLLITGVFLFFKDKVYYL